MAKRKSALCIFGSTYKICLPSHQNASGEGGYLSETAINAANAGVFIAGGQIVKLQTTAQIAAQR